MNAAFGTRYDNSLMKEKPKMQFLLHAMLILCMAYVLADLYWPLQRDLRRFDPAELAKRETRMWQSYYDHRHVALLLQLAAMLRDQYHFPLLRSYLGAFHATTAAFIFKGGENRIDYEKALPALQRYFKLIRRTGNLAFDVHRTARLELEWWIVHREHARHSDTELGQACADAAASLYTIAANATYRHGLLRARAMLMLDARAASGNVEPADWTAIEALLCESYRELNRVAAKKVPLRAVITDNAPVCLASPAAG
ncbi:MAG TPA: hypothetical protein VF427_04515 [Noviherbaspirillum sp.]